MGTGGGLGWERGRERTRGSLSADDGEPGRYAMDQGLVAMSMFNS